MSEEIILDGDRLLDRNSMALYMKEILDLPDYFGKNLDALHDVLTEVNEDITFVLTKEHLRTICESRYAYKVLLVIGDAADLNRHINIKFAK